MDRRVTRAFEWLSGVFATLLVIVLVWLGSTLTQLKEQQAVFISELKYTQRVNESQDNRLDIYEGRLRQVERIVK
jgi:hypothetical protein